MRIEASDLKPQSSDLNNRIKGEHMRDFHDLDAWRKAHQLTLWVYKLTKDFPSNENFGITLTLRRGTMNLTTKIAEACGREDGEPYAAALRHARGLGVELEYQFLLAYDLGLIDEPTHIDLTDRVIEIRRMLSGVIKRHSPPSV
jgi:four helix bundle protein